MAKAKEVVSTLKLEIQAGKANPAPPIGPILGQNGIPIQDFCNEFNNKTKEMGNFMIPVGVTVFKDRSFKMKIGKPTITSVIKNKLNLQKGSPTPNKEKVGKIKKSDMREMAEMKLEDFNTKDLDSATRIVEGVARSMGLEIVD